MGRGMKKKRNKQKKNKIKCDYIKPKTTKATTKLFSLATCGEMRWGKNEITTNQ